MGLGAAGADDGAMRTFTTTIARARRMAEATPSDRNRYVDALRAISILAVVVGHWLIAAPYAVGDDLRGVNMLAHTPWTQWLTWVFQVMPVFFAVGGYSNTVSWRAASERGHGYGWWLTNRLRRLAIPAAVLVAVWAVIGIAVAAAGVDPALVRLGSQSALVPVWFLAVYVMIIAIGPLMIRAWERWGWRSFLGLAATAGLVDLLVAGGGSLLGWLNFVFVWAAVHQLGVAWNTGRLRGATAGFVAALAAVTVITLVSAGPYPIAMVGVPGAASSNNSPPTLAMIAFGTMQVCALLALESRARRLLARPAAWTATVLVNGMIMSIYLWHLTAMVLAIGASLLVGGVGLGIEPSTPLWWTTRPLWIAALAVATLPFIALFGRIEQVKALPADARPGALPALASAIGLAIGLGILAAAGIQGFLAGVNPIAVGLPLLGATVVAVAGRSHTTARSMEAVEEPSRAA